MIPSTPSHKGGRNETRIHFLGNRCRIAVMMHVHASPNGLLIRCVLLYFARAFTNFRRDLFRCEMRTRSRYLPPYLAIYPISAAAWLSVYSLAFTDHTHDLNQ